MAEKVIPYEFAPDDEVEIVMDAFRVLFDSDRVHSINTKIVRVGPTSDIIYVPKGLNGKVATIIIWKNKEKYYQSGGKIRDAREPINTENVPVEDKQQPDGQQDQLGV